MANNIRRYNGEYKLLRNVSNPVMILGFPLPLALIYGAGLFVPVLLAILLKIFAVGITIIIVVPTLVGVITIMGVKKFYKKYGITGFYLRRRDMSLHNEIKGDMSIQEALREKINLT